jgi:hypothetical protein
MSHAVVLGWSEPAIVVGNLDLIQGIVMFFVMGPFPFFIYGTL